ncbi:MAG: response regulator [Magnetococcales bacterium]|nr:response regulator [Magnetococcales bacterium]
MGEPVKPFTPVARILLIDDEVITERLLRRMVESTPSLNLFYCQDPLQALKLAATIRPAVILTDLMMPHLDGISLVRQLRSRRAFSQVPILMLSAEDDPFIKAQAFAAGASDYLVKLPNEVEMIARLQHHAHSFFTATRQLGNKEICSDIIHSDLKGFWIIDVETRRIIDVNDTLCVMLGFSREVLLHKSPLDFVDEENRPDMLKALDWIPKTDHRIHEIYLLTLLHGPLYTRFCVTSSNQMLGRQAVAVFTFLNLSKLNLEYFEILKNEFRFIADSVPGLLWLSNQNNNRIFFNKAWLSFRGKLLEEEIENGWLQGIHPDDQERYLYDAGNAFRHKHAYAIEFRLLDQLGQYRWIYETALPRFAGNNLFMGFSGSCTDITERKLLESRIHQVNFSLEQQVQRRTAELQKEVQERRQAEMMERRANQAQQAINRLLHLALQGAPLLDQLQRGLQYLVDLPWLNLVRQGAIYFVDPRTRTLQLVASTNLSATHRQECSTVPYDHCLCGRVASCQQPLYAEAPEPCHPLQEMVLPAPIGQYALPIRSEQHTLGVLTLYLNQQEPFDSFESHFLDTVSQVLALLIEHSQISQLQIARQRAEAANQAKSDFLATMSHEIRTPLNVVLGILELLRDSAIEQSCLDQVQLALGAGRILLYLINDLLDYSKIEANQLALDTIQFNLRELLDDIAQSMAPLAHAKGVELTGFFPQELPVDVLGDPNRLRQILINLVGNAIKFTPAGGLVEFHGGPVNRSQGRIEFLFEIRDTGIGIAPKDREMIFERFVQAHHGSANHYGGTGLGLAICRRLVSLMDGEIGIDDNPFAPNGSIFYFTVQLQEAASHATLYRPDSLNGYRMLIVGSHGLQLAMLRNLLQGWGVHSEDVSEWRTACETLQQAHRRQQPYQVVIVNQWLTPNQPAELMHCHGPEWTCAFLLLLDRPDQGVDQAMSLPGEALCLRKPFRAEQLHDKLSRLLKCHPETVSEYAVCAAPSASLPWRQATILLADDQSANRTILLGMLAKLGCDRARCLSASNGEEALQLLQTGYIDLLLLDCQMPVMDGYQVTRRIRQQEQQQACPAIPIIAITADATPGNRQTCLEAGMNEVLTKPLSLQALQQVLDNYLPAPPNDSPLPAQPEATLPPTIQNTLQALQTLGLAEEDIPSVARMIIDQLPDLLASMDNHLQNNETEQLHALSHVIRGSMLHTIFPEMQQAAKTMHEAVRAHNWREAEQQLRTLRQAFAPIHAALQEWLQQLTK